MRWSRYGVCRNMTCADARNRLSFEALDIVDCSPCFLVYCSWLQKVEVPLKVRKSDGTAARLMRGTLPCDSVLHVFPIGSELKCRRCCVAFAGTDAASISVYLFFSRNEVHGSPFSDAAFSSSSSNLLKGVNAPPTSVQESIFRAVCVCCRAHLLVSLSFALVDHSRLPRGIAQRR